MVKSAAGSWPWSSRTRWPLEPGLHRRRADRARRARAQRLSRREAREAARSGARQGRPSAHDAIWTATPTSSPAACASAPVWPWRSPVTRRLLIADEPTTALDVTIQAQILRLRLDLRERLGVAQVLMTHNVGVAAQTCDRIAVMYAGSVVEQGTASEVLKHSRHPYTKALYECLPHGKSVAELHTIPGSVPDLIDPPPGCRFHPRCNHAMEVCVAVKPEPTTISREHWAACHWANEHVAGAAKGTS